MNPGRKASYLRELTLETVDPVERGVFVAFRQRRVIEHGIDEVMDLALGGPRAASAAAQPVT
jgi:hypothetical protein